jgi:hypothetical protein
VDVVDVPVLVQGFYRDSEGVAVIGIGQGITHQGELYTIIHPGAKG